MSSVMVEKKQPSLDDIKVGVLMFPGPVVTKRSFKQSAPRNIRGITESEFLTILETLGKNGYGTLMKLRSTPNARSEILVFVKLENLPDHASLVNGNDSLNSSICQCMKAKLYLRKRKRNCSQSICFPWLNRQVCEILMLLKVFCYLCLH